MKKNLLYSAFLIGALASSVHSAKAQAVEKTVAFKTPEGKYISAAKDSMYDLSGTAPKGRETFNLVDENGGELADGDSIKVMLLDGTKGWKMKEEGLARGSAVRFKVKKVGEKWAIQTKDGKFLGATPSGAVGAVDTVEAALQLEIVPVASAEKKPAASPAAAAASPAAE